MLQSDTLLHHASAAAASLFFCYVVAAETRTERDDVIISSSYISALIEFALTPTQVFLNRDGPLPYKPRHDPILRNIHSSCLRLFYDVDISLFDLIPQVLYLKLHSK